MSENPSERPAFEPLKAIGLFLSVFGLAVIGAMLLDMSSADRVINLISGLVIMAIGGVAFALGWLRSRQ